MKGLWGASRDATESAAVFALVVLMCAALAQSQPICSASSDRVDSLPGIAAVAECQYAGYTTTDVVHNGNLFYWLFESRRDPTNDPLVLWLNGGPGCSSLFGLFNELGPYRITSDYPAGLEVNDWSWNTRANTLFIDQPFGTGWSYADPEGLATTEEVVAQELYEAIVNVLAMHPEFATKPFFIAGESYAGHYIPWLARRILAANANPAETSLNLHGLVVGDPLVDFLDQRTVKPYFAHAQGLITRDQRFQSEAIVHHCYTAYARGDDDALDICEHSEDFMRASSGWPVGYDVRIFEASDNDTLTESYLNRDDVRAAINVGHTTSWEGCSDPPYFALRDDILLTTKHIFGDSLFGRVRTFIFSGQYDMRDGVLEAEAWINTLSWPGSDLFFSAPRNLWKVGGEMAGYVVEAANVAQVTVLGAGHFVPQNQPVHALDLLDRMLENRPFCTDAPGAAGTCVVNPDDQCALLNNGCSNGNGVCSSAGRCECNEGFTGLDCSTAVNTIFLQDDETHSLGPFEWKMYRLSPVVASLVAAHTRVNVTAIDPEGDTRLALYVGRGAPPTTREYLYADVSRVSDNAVTIPSEDLVGSAETWYAGVYNHDRNARVTFVIEWKEVETYQPALTPGSPPPPPVYINVDTSGFSAGAFVGGIMVGLGIGLIMFGCYVVGKESKQGPRRLGGGPRPHRGVTSSRVPLVDSDGSAESMEGVDVVGSDGGSDEGSDAGVPPPAGRGGGGNDSSGDGEGDDDNNNVV